MKHMKHLTNGLSSGLSPDAEASDHSPAHSPAYAELQVTSNFSFLRGASHPEELVARATELGLAAMAITDRNTLAGVVRAHGAARQAGLKLIVGARLDLIDAPSLLCLPGDRAAYGRLSRLISRGQRRAEKGRCTLYLDDVAAHAEGQILIALPPADWDWREVLAGKPAQSAAPPAPPDAAAGETAEKPQSETTPPACFADELHRLRAALPSATPLYLAATCRHDGNDQARLAALSRLADRCGTELVITGDVLYHDAARRSLQDVLSCIRTGCTIHEAGLRLHANGERHLKAADDMARLFGRMAGGSSGPNGAVLAKALARTVEIANACRFSLDELAYDYPDEPVPAGKTAQSHLEELTWRGAAWRFPDGLPDKIRTTLERELSLIAELDYAPYFLTVHDIVTFAHAHNILCQGRGSAANSAVCYCLGITAVNPAEIDLLFDRFISPERREPPDIDVDFEHERREEVIQYIYARYGRERAALAATVISYRARSALRDIGKAMGLSADVISAMSSLVWGFGRSGPPPDEHVAEAGLDPSDPLLRAVLSLTGELIGFPRHLSQHVGGFVLTRSPLTEIVPVGNAAMENRTVIEWDKDDLDTLGLLKVDVLALGMLSCIHRAFDLLGAHHGIDMSLAKVPRADKATYDMLCRADSLGVFQVESRAQMNMLPRLKPRCFYDLVIEVAIVRPGPIQGDMVHPYLRRRDGLEREDYPAPDPAHGPPDELRQILGKTKGIPLFQEQAMRIAMVAARFSAAEANELRKAMATFRRRGTIGELEDRMVSRMIARGYSRDFATRCFNQIKGFGDYGFPESHAASFAHLVYVSSWLKCHYPAVFACALLNSQPMGFYAPAQIVRDAREHGVEVRAVDVNHSHWDCTLEPGGFGGDGNDDSGRDSGDGGPALRLGLRMVDGLRRDDGLTLVAARNVAAHNTKPPSARTKAEQTEQERRHEGLPFTSVHDLWRRSGLSVAALERLAAADAFRSMGLDRRQALWQVRGLDGGDPLPLFDWGETRAQGPEPQIELPQMALSDHVVSDYQTLRLSLKAHPMSFLRARLQKRRIISCAALADRRDGQWVNVSGLVLVRQRPGSARGVVFMTIEDETGIANIVVWAKTLEKFRKAVMGARLITIAGRVQRHEDIIHVVASRLSDDSPLLAALTDPDEAQTGHEICRNVSTTSATPARTHPRNQRIIPKSRDFH